LLRSARSRSAALPLVSFITLVAVGGCARPTARDAAPAPARGANAPAVDADEQNAHAVADELRARVLAATDLTDLGESCDVGTLRTFKDTSRAGRLETEREIERLERLIIARGVDNSLDTPEAYDLLTTVIAWEAGDRRPRWDVPAGLPAPRTIAPGMVGKFRNPTTGRCEAYVATDTTTFVIPPVTSYTPPTLDSAKAVVYVGEPGLKQAREAFYSRIGATDSTSVFTYTRLRAVVVWRDYAVVAVNRPAERRGIQQLPVGEGGASYIFHRADKEWRLLAIARTWG